MAARPLVAALALLLSGCAVGPHYTTPPVVPAAPNWIAPAADGPVEAAWWRRFGDTRLTALIAAADAGNLDVRIAEARLREARANRDAAAGGRLPQVNASGSATKNRVSQNGQIPIGRIPGFSRDLDLYDIGFDASWEIDLWGHAARQVQAASARAAAAEADRHGAIVSLHAELARTYVELRAAQARRTSLAADAGAQADLAKLTHQRFGAGEASRFDDARAEAQAGAIAAQLPGLDADISASAYRIALLLGKPPESVVDLLTPAPLPQAPATIAMGLRSELLTRRPDVTATERQLAAATADVGVATAELFPRLSLLGSIGQQAQSPGDLTDSGSLHFQFDPSLHWPIFAAGSIRAKVRAADARADAAAARYEQAVLTALNESETAANRFVQAAETARRSAAARDAQRTALDLAEQRYRSGEDDLLALLQARSAWEQADRAASDAGAQQALQAVALYKALGGGWGN
ncbi:efflux transporter, outer membrane factor (OMF) lipoprotein, NodT family [Sphingomonas sp. YR710]|uniref:efflux transporter outer membrane subunit n=1 Tax=Sphingomonas sp. YR710 TaxID=1882773 RepID=UPI0008825211|nr:efflux transporter outer membrane subunit [Sphingomonas sp. YR710]SDD22011.1 efflux transporter, outer membrane factor (OMF) lipoprotein, NodT family [Sphingomonas sp. YR710]